MKGNDEVIQEFNEVVNMTASELEKWLKSDDSNSAGWPKEDENGETVGHDSGRKIVEILKENPKKEPEKYTDEQVQHMRKVVSYCKRHLAQETKANNDKSPEEVKKTKSYASLKNWGHDFLKAQGKENGRPKKGETVSWNWGQGQPKGKVLDVKAEDTTITTKNGNEVSRKGDEEDPAVVLDTGKNKAIKKAHELN
ncbi:Hypervirulence associated protein, TUDOR domain [Fusarium oxysporum f. sp. vasinfectum]|nr:Hypervirulence associated protein, TUDOR domain [Fusarium oxysporum f. sp. vasinfectum]